MLVLDWGCLQWQSTTDIIVLCMNHPKTISEAHHKNYAKKTELLPSKLLNFYGICRCQADSIPALHFFSFSFLYKPRIDFWSPSGLNSPLSAAIWIHQVTIVMEGCLFLWFLEFFFFYHTLILNFRFPALGTWNRLKYPCLRTYIYLSDF